MLVVYFKIYYDTSQVTLRENVAKRYKKRGLSNGSNYTETHVAFAAFL